MFRGDGGDVHTHWGVYTERMDLMVQEALRLNVKWSLMELSRSLCGDGKTLLDPVFKVKVILDDGTGIEFSPCIEEMSGFINTVSTDLINTIKDFKRLPEVLNKRVASAREVSVNLSLFFSCYHIFVPPSFSFLFYVNGASMIEI